MTITQPTPPAPNPAAVTPAAEAAKPAAKSAAKPATKKPIVKSKNSTPAGEQVQSIPYSKPMYLDPHGGVHTVEPSTAPPTGPHKPNGTGVTNP